MKKGIVKILIFIFVPIVVIAIVYVAMNLFKKAKPGLYFTYECKEGSENKFYEDQGANEAVCKGIYVPFGVKIGKLDYVKVLSKMNEIKSMQGTIQTIVAQKEQTMKDLAIAAIKQLS